MATVAVMPAACADVVGYAAHLLIARATTGDVATAWPVTRIRHICIANPMRLQNPFPQNTSTSMGPFDVRVTQSR